MNLNFRKRKFIFSDNKYNIRDIECNFKMVKSILVTVNLVQIVRCNFAIKSLNLRSSKSVFFWWIIWFQNWNLSTRYSFTDSAE